MAASPQSSDGVKIKDRLLEVLKELGPLNYKKLFSERRLYFGKNEDGSLYEIVDNEQLKHEQLN